MYIVGEGGWREGCIVGEGVVGEEDVYICRGSREGGRVHVGG